MGNNEEIRKRIETYRSVLLVLNWICSIALVIVGFIMMNKMGGLTLIIVIIVIIIGIIGHFLVNVALAIPFILLNNGDFLAVMVSKNGASTASNNVNTQQTIVKYDDNKKEEYKLKNSAPLKYGSSYTTNTIKTLNVGTIVKCISKNNPEWYCVETAEGEKGFCLSSDLIKI